MDWLTPVLSIVALLLLVWQFYGSKGTIWHIVRAMTVGKLTLTVIFLNTIRIVNGPGLTWDLGFILHTGLGVLFIIFFIATVITGTLVHQGRSEIKPVHRLYARSTLGLMIASLVAAVLIPLLR